MEIKIQLKEQDNISKVHIRDDQIKKYITWDEIVNLVQDAMPQFKKYDAIYGIPRGGLIVATILSYKLNIPLITETKDITQKTLIVDDICDSGKTLLEYQNNDAYTLFYKHEAKTQPKFYSKIISQETWIVFPWE